MTPVVAVTGSTGVLGRHLRPAIGDRAVMLLSRRRLELRPNERWAPLELARTVSLPDLPAGVQLCHLAYDASDHASNLLYTTNLVEAVNGCPQIAHVVLVSTVSVYGSRAEGVLTETSACRPDSEYARTKLACEQLWLDRLRSDCRLTVLRPSTVMSVDGLALTALSRDAVERPLRGMLKRLLNGRATTHLVAVGNVVAAVDFVLRRHDESGHGGRMREFFIVADDDQPENRSYSTLQDVVRGLCGRGPLPGRSLPRLCLVVFGRMTGRALGVRRTFSSAALREAGFVPPATLLDEISDVVRQKLPTAAAPVS